MPNISNRPVSATFAVWLHLATIISGVRTGYRDYAIHTHNVGTARMAVILGHVFRLAWCLRVAMINGSRLFCRLLGIAHMHLYGALTMQAAGCPVADHQLDKRVIFAIACAT